MDRMRSFNELNIVDYIIVVFSLIGSGIASFFRRNTNGFSVTKKLSVFIIDIVGSVSIGTTAFFIVYGWNENLVLSAGIGSLFGHIGTRGIYLLELMIAEKLRSESMRKAIEEYHNKEKRHV